MDKKKEEVKSKLKKKIRYPKNEEEPDLDDRKNKKKSFKNKKVNKKSEINISQNINNISYVSEEQNQKVIGKKNHLKK